MRFDHPWLLLVGLAIAGVLAWAYVAAERRVTERDLLYSNVQFLASAIGERAWISRLLRGTFIAALVLAAIAVGGPHVRLPLPSGDGVVFICIDTSGSMASTDVSPTRAAAARAAAAAFIDESASGTRIGVIAFAGNAVIVSPLTANHAQVKAALESIPPPNGATAIGDALQLAETELPPGGHRAIVLITDGVNNTGVDPLAVAEDLGAHHVPVYTIGIGTPNGDIIGGAQSTIDEGALQQYAAVSGGAYSRAENAVQLRDALARLGRATSIRMRDVAASFAFAIAAAAGFAATMLVGLMTGRIP